MKIACFQINKSMFFVENDTNSINELFTGSSHPEKCFVESTKILLNRQKFPLAHI